MNKEIHMKPSTPQQPTIGKIMPFPTEEHKDIKKRLDSGRSVHTVRINEEFNVYQRGNVYTTPWGQEVIILKVTRLTDVKKYEFYKEVSKVQIARIGDNPNIEIVMLKSYSPEELQMIEREPLNLTILDADRTIEQERLLEVKENFVMAPSSSDFHPEGLYSEEIFGAVATEDRLYRFGYINLRTRIFHPRVYKIIAKLKRSYVDIISGSAHAIWDDEIHDFLPVPHDHKDADTGYSFFMEHFEKIKFEFGSSLNRNDRINLLKKYKDNLHTRRWLVLPAGLRDYKEEGGTAAVEEINKLYTTLISLSKAIPKGGTENPIYNSVRYAMQKKIVEIEEHIYNILDGKKGYVQKMFGARSTTLCTRNVLTAVKMSAESPDDPQFLKLNEAKIPLFQAMKAFQPFIIHGLKRMFLNQIFDPTSEQVGVVDPKTNNLVFARISEQEKGKFLSSDGIIDLINMYKDRSFRTLPATVISEGKPYYLFLVYDEGDKITHLRSQSDLKQFLDRQGRKFDPKLLRPMTYREMFYSVTYFALRTKHVLLTRYPVVGKDGIYPARIHLASSDIGRKVDMLTGFADHSVPVPNYPTVGRPCVDTIAVHPSRMANLGADYDGDLISAVGVFSKNANEEIAVYLNTPGSVVQANGKLSHGGTSDLIALTFLNLSKMD